MEKLDKAILLQDLCARLPYGVIVRYKGHNIIIKDKVLTGSDLDSNMEYYRPYLRQMSSMTGEEKEEERKLWDIVTRTRNDLHYLYTDFLLSHHFDYRGLIEKGLALEAPDDMYSNGITCYNIPPYSLTVDKDKVPETNLEPPEDKLFYMDFNGL